MVKIRRAKEQDAERILYLLHQILEIHAAIRPDIFRSGTTKYAREEILDIMRDNQRPTYVAVDENDKVLGYALCRIRERPFLSTMVPFTEMFIDDFCVDESERGKGIGRALFEYIKEEAKRIGCYEVTLTVWEGNDSAKAFYDKMGMKPKETLLETIL